MTSLDSLQMAALVAVVFGPAILIPVLWQIRADKRQHLGLSIFARRKIRKRGLRADAVVLNKRDVKVGDDSIEVIIVEVRPTEGEPFRTEIAVLGNTENVAGYSGNDRFQLVDKPNVHVFYLPEDPKAAVLDLDELGRRYQAMWKERNRETAERELTARTEAEHERLRLLQGGSDDDKRSR